MPFPPPEKFGLDGEPPRWVASWPEHDCDIAVCDADGAPDRTEIDRIARAAGADPQPLLDAADEFVRAFCREAVLEDGAQPAPVELTTVKSRFGERVVVRFSYQCDLYGLWSVGFSEAAPGKWTPLTFGRDDL